MYLIYVCNVFINDIIYEFIEGFFIVLVVFDIEFYFLLKVVK